MDRTRSAGRQVRGNGIVRASAGCLGCPDCLGICAEIVEMVSLPEAVLGAGQAAGHGTEQAP